MKLLLTFIYRLGFAMCLFIGSVNSFAQTCNDRILPVTPDERFELSEYEVTDLRTGLIWQRCSVGQQWDGTNCTGSAIYYTWPEALALASGGWRVPNINELLSIVETACANPAINSNIFPNTMVDRYWTSSPYNGLTVSSVGFDYGYDGLRQKVDSSFARLVRGGH